MSQKLLVILGPTATGKTDFALKLAKKFNGEIVSCDSRQIYVGLDIGTGKLPDQLKFEKAKGYWKVSGVNIWMYDVVDIRKQYTVADYIKDASRVIRDIRERGKLPIIVGGTGLYLKALLGGLSNLAIPVDENLRKKLEKLNKEQLQDRLKKVSLKRWEKLNSSDRENPRRLIRAIELATSSLRGVERLSNLDKRLPRPFGARNDILRIGLTAPRGILYQRVDKSVVSRIRQGMVDEAKRMQKRGLTLKRMKQLGLEYGVLANYLEGKIMGGGDRELIKILKYKVHGYVRRQITWFKKEKDVNWFDITVSDFREKLEKLISDWYNQADVTTKN